MVTLLLKLVSHHRCMVEIDNRRRFERCLKQLEQLVGETKVEVTETRTAVVNSRLSTTLFACNLSTERHLEKILGTYRTFTFYELRSFIHMCRLHLEIQKRIFQIQYSKF